MILPDLAPWYPIAVPVGYFLACVAAAASGAAFPPGPWYERLAKPSWTPPNWLFPLAWTVMYVLIALAAWRVSGVEGPAARAGLALWTMQIAFNAIWSPTFFGKRRPGWAFLVLVFLWLSVAGTLACFLQAALTAGLMFAPYIIWCTYAGALNLAVWVKNPREAWRAA